MFPSVEEFYIPARRIWIPSAAFSISMVDERFDLAKKPTSWTFGNSTENYFYDDRDRLVRVVVGRQDEIKYNYEEEIFPKQVPV